MKKRKLLFVFMFLLPLAGFAQEHYSSIRFGIKGGANLSKLSWEQDIYVNTTFPYRFGYFGGGFMEISSKPSSKFKGQLEILYCKYNFKEIIESSQIVRTHLNQLSVPLVAKYFFVPSVSINIGMSANFNINGDIHTIESSSFEPVTVNLKDVKGFQRLQAGALVGATSYIYKGLFIDGRYNYYFWKLIDSPGNIGIDFKYTNVFQLSIGYKF